MDFDSNDNKIKVDWTTVATGWATIIVVAVCSYKVGRRRSK